MLVRQFTTGSHRTNSARLVDFTWLAITRPHRSSLERVRRIDGYALQTTDLMHVRPGRRQLGATVSTNTTTVDSARNAVPIAGQRANYSGDALLWNQKVNQSKQVG